MDKKNTVIFFDLDNTMYHYSKFLAELRDKCFDVIISHGVDVSLEELREEFPKIRKQCGSNSTKHFDELIKRFDLPKRENHYLLSKILSENRPETSGASLNPDRPSPCDRRPQGRGVFRSDKPCSGGDRRGCAGTNRAAARDGQTRIRDHSRRHRDDPTRVQ